MNYTTIEKIRVYILKHESELDPELQDIFEEVIGRKPKTEKPENRVMLTQTMPKPLSVYPDASPY